MGLQILQYEFIGPVPLAEWGPPMGRLLYLVLLKDKDKFNILYAGDCEHTDDRAFFVRHPRFGCWVDRARSDTALYLAVFPMANSDVLQRQRALHRIISNYNPPCNLPSDLPRELPSYNVRRTHVDSDGDGNQKDGDAGKNDTVEAGVDAVRDDAVTADRNRSAIRQSGALPSSSSPTTSPPPPTQQQQQQQPPAKVEIACPCCGSDMTKERDIGKRSALYRCTGCGMSDTRTR